jgi:Sulfotransferase family
MSNVSPPIFILGIMPRSGTNYLHDLITLHPACTRGLLGEDYLLHQANHLVDFVENVSNHWLPHWSTKEALYRHLGESLISFISSKGETRRIVTKTPSVVNLEKFSTFFPESPVIILVRDGRSVVESGVRSFGWKREDAIRRWSNRANIILNFMSSEHAKKHGNFHLLKYEDLYNNTEYVMKSLMGFLEIDESAYDFEKAKQLPVKGSSTFHGHGKSKVHWSPIKKDATFEPLLRWQEWSRSRHERFNWLAGDQLERLGYSPKRFDGNAALWRLKNRVLDLKWEHRSSSLEK